MVKFGEAFKLPFSNWGRTGVFFLLAFIMSLVSGVMSILSDSTKNAALESKLLLLVLFLIAFVFLILLSLPLSGYGLRIASYAAHGKNVMPPFESFFGLLTVGLKYFVAAIVYALPFLLVGGVAFVLVFAGIASKSVALTLVGILFFIPIGLLWLFFSLYILPMVMAHFAYENRFVAFFELGKILKYAFTAAYFVPWIVAGAYAIGLLLPYFIIFLPITIISLALPPVQLLLAPVSAAYAVVLTSTTMNLYGQAYYDIKTAEGGKPVAAADAEKAKRRSKK